MIPFQNILEVLSKLYGWLLVAFVSAINFFEPGMYCFFVVFASVIGDLFWGVCASIRLKRFILSKILRKSVIKIGIYGFALALTFLIESILHENTLIGIKVIAVLASVCELWSMSANMLIVYPDMPFLKIFRLQLKGEMESKIGKKLDNILLDNTLN